MSNLKGSFLWLRIVAAGLGLASAQVQGQLTTPFISSSETLAGGAGLVDIVEVAVEDPNPFPVAAYSVGYFVDVKSPSVQVGSFAVSLSSLSNDPLTMRSEWFSSTISAVAWDAGTMLPNGVSTATIGLYSDFFEPSSPGIAFFTDDMFVSSINEATDSDVFTDPALLEFGLEPDALPSSATLIFDTGGAIIDGTAIPEPSAALLGLLTIGTLYRRRR